jgi:transcriptional regulator with XRE-family HTH domain
VDAYTAQAVKVEARDLAKRLAAEMDRQKVSLRKLEGATGVNKTTISRWRRGETTRVEVAKVRKVAEALGTTAGSLLNLPETSESPVAAPAVIPREALKRLADLDPTVLATLEQTLPQLRAIVEDVRGERGRAGD